MKSLNNLKIEIIEPLLKKEAKEFDIFTKKHWGDHVYHDDGENDFFGTTTFVVIAKINSTLVGLSYVFIRDLVFQGEAVSYGALGGGLTHTDFRHMGVATSIVKKCIEELTRRNVDISILCTDIEKNGNMLNKNGFVPLGRPYSFINLKGKIKEDPAGMIAPCNSKEKFEKILKSEEKLFIGISNF